MRSTDGYARRKHVLGVVQQRPEGLCTTAGGCEGAAGLALVDENGEARLRLILLPDGTPGVGLHDERGKMRVLLLLERTQGVRPEIRLLDENETALCVLGISSDGSPVLALVDRDSRAHASLMVHPEAGPALDVVDSNGSCASLGRAMDGRLRLILSDTNGNVVWQSP